MAVQQDKSPIIICKRIQKYYGEGSAQVHALRGVDLEIYKGELRMLMGPSGSGKTTLVSIIAGILTQSEGTCLVNNIDLNQLTDKDKTHYRGKNIGFVFQNFNFFSHLLTSALQDIDFKISFLFLFFQELSLCFQYFNPGH